MITREKYIVLTPELIQEQMSSKESTVLEETLNSVVANSGSKSLAQIKSEIISDNSLSDEEKQKLFDMIDIIESSYVYWTQELEPPIDDSPQGISVRNQQIIAADCIWFWQAGIASGLNPYVAIGASAVGSFAAWLNGR
ncbi:MAG: hypothetical protein QM751_13650 [Paludibacteraceae bacterium]